MSRLSETFPEALFFFLQQPETDRKSVGGNQPIIGKKLNRGSGTVENTGLQKNDVVHPLHQNAPSWGVLHGAIKRIELSTRATGRQRVRIRVYNQRTPEKRQSRSEARGSGAEGVLDGRIFPSSAPYRSQGGPLTQSVVDAL